MFATDVNFAKAQIVVSFFKLELFSMEMSEERCIDFIRHAEVLSYGVPTGVLSCSYVIVLLFLRRTYRIPVWFVLRFSNELNRFL